MIYALQVELTKKDLQKIRKELAAKNAVFSDKRFLDSLFLPSGILGRKNEATVMLSHIDSAKNGLVVPLISVYGRSGSGKSTVVKLVCETVSDIASYAFVNLRKSKTIFGCANMILTELGAEPLKSAEGLNKVVEKIGERITSMMSDKKLFLLVLDEYDSVFSDTHGKPSDFVYKLLTMEENLREKGILVCIVTISNNALNDHQLDDRVKSRAGSSEVFFAPYSKDELVGILRDRADKAFAIKIEDDVIEYCATLSFYDYGDARRGIDLLRLAGEICNGKTVTFIDVNSAHEQLQKDRSSMIVSNASFQQKTLIFSICIETMYSKTGWVSSSKIFDRYKQTVEGGLEELTYRRIVDLLVDLKNTGLLASTKQSRDRGGYGIEYKIMFSPEIVAPIINNELWQQHLRHKSMEEAKAEMRKKYNSNNKKNSFYRKW